MNMSNVKNAATPGNGSASKERPPWLAELRAEVRPLREEVRNLREEVRSLRGKEDEGRNLSVKEAAEIAGISRRKLDMLIHNGDCPSLKIGNRRLVPNLAFRAWLRRKAEEGQQ